MRARDIVAWNVREWRTSLGLSQEALADAAGIDRTVISDVERKAVAISLDMLDRLAVYFDAEAADLLQKPEPGRSEPKPLKAGRKPRA